MDGEAQPLSPKEFRDLTIKLESGEIQPVRGAADDGETFFYQNEHEPLISQGRVPGANWLYVLKPQDGNLLVISGSLLRGSAHVWSPGSTLSE